MLTYLKHIFLHETECSTNSWNGRHLFGFKTNMNFIGVDWILKEEIATASEYEYLFLSNRKENENAMKNESQYWKVCSKSFP